MRIILITTCTGRKKITPPPSLHAANLPEGIQSEVLRSWKSRLRAQTSRTTASKVYCGRGFSEILKTATLKGLELWVISAGLGLISAQREIPSYNLTISPSSDDSIKAKIISKKPFDPCLWWSDLNKELNGTSSPLADLITRNNDALFVISLSRPYAEMVYSDLLSLAPIDQQRIRILGLSKSDIFGKPLQLLCMPYDERFDGPDGILTGTKADFPQRVCRHFIENILSQPGANTPLYHADKVTSFLKGKRAPILIKRPQRTDSQIKQIILENWNDAGGSAAKMLRILRDSAEVACEQNRFAQLFKEIKAQNYERG